MITNPVPQRPWPPLGVLAPLPLRTGMVGLRGSLLDIVPEGAPNRSERSVSTSFQDTLVAAPGVYAEPEPHQRPTVLL